MKKEIKNNITYYTMTEEELNKIKENTKRETEKNLLNNISDFIKSLNSFINR